MTNSNTAGDINYVGPCQSDVEVINSKDFKRIVNIIFRTIQNDASLQCDIDGTIKVKKAFDKLLSNQALDEQEIKTIEEFLILARDTNSLIRKSIDKVLEKIEVHSFLDNVLKFHSIGKHSFTNRIIKNKDINSVLITTSNKAKSLIRKNKDNSENSEEVSEIINMTFFQFCPDSIVTLAKKCRHGATCEKPKELRDKFSLLVKETNRRQIEISKEINNQRNSNKGNILIFHRNSPGILTRGMEVPEH